MNEVYVKNPEEFDFDTYIEKAFCPTRDEGIRKVRERYIGRNFSIFKRIRDFGERVNESIGGMYKGCLNDPSILFFPTLLQPLLKPLIIPPSWEYCKNKKEKGELIGFGLSGLVNTAATIFAGITSGPIGGLTTYVLGSFVCDYFFAGGAGALASESKRRKAIEDKFNQEILPMYTNHYSEVEKALRKRYNKMEEERRKIDNLVNNIPVNKSKNAETGEDKRDLRERVRE